MPHHTPPDPTNYGMLLIRENVSLKHSACVICIMRSSSINMHTMYTCMYVYVHVHGLSHNLLMDMYSAHPNDFAGVSWGGQQAFSNFAEVSERW